MIRYLVTDGTAAFDIDRWTTHIADWLERGIDFVQIRERDLSARQLAEITRRILALPNPHAARVFVNDRLDVAIACGAHGVHLRAGSVLPLKFAGCGLMTSVSCHSAAEMEFAPGADLILLAPVFTPLSKDDVRETLGIDGLRAAVGRTSIPVLALGGVTASNAPLCMAAGAAGVAGISFFRGI